MKLREIVVAWSRWAAFGSGLLLLTAAAAERQVWLGTTGEGGARGIYTASFDSATGKLSQPVLAAAVPRPGFLTLSQDGAFLYSTSLMAPAAGGRPEGAVAAFAVEEKKLRELGRRPSGGGGPCFVTLDAGGGTLLVANYGGGSVASFPVGSDGALGARKSLSQHRGSSVHPTRQKAPHAHSIYPGPDGRFAYAPDLGTDEVWIYALDPEAATLTPAGRTKLRPGSGPRHMKFGRDGRHAFVLGELDLTVTSLDRDPPTGELRAREVVAVLPEEADGRGMTCSEILISADGRNLYTANRDVDGRGRDSLSVFSVGPGGTLERLETVAAEVAIPRHIQLSPDGRWLLVAGQKSGGVPVFKVTSGGRLKFSGQRAELPGAMCVKFAP
jgi:6-phosphogluconolactonase